MPGPWPSGPATTAACCCPWAPGRARICDWPATTWSGTAWAPAPGAGLPPGGPAAVFPAGVVLSCPAAARAAGVRRGLRRREAQYRCPTLATLERDPAEEARAFEPVVVAVEALAPGVEI